MFTSELHVLLFVGYYDIARLILVRNTCSTERQRFFDVTQEFKIVLLTFEVRVSAVRVSKQNVFVSNLFANNVEPFCR